MTASRFVSIGECMLELSGGEPGSFQLGYAGDTLNTAWYARAMLPAAFQVDYITALGDDLYSKRMRRFLMEHDIGTDHIRETPNRRAGLYLIHQADGDRCFTYWRENSAAKCLADDEAALTASLKDASIIYFSGITLAILAPSARERLLTAVAAERTAGARVALDPNVRPGLWPSFDEMRAALTAAASICDIVMPTHADEAILFNDCDPAITAARYLRLGVAEVIVKDGPKPALIATPGRLDYVAPNFVQAVIDSTGAGDSFNGAYLAGRMAGLGLRESAALAHGIAEVVIGQRGALVDPGALHAGRASFLEQCALI